MIVYTLKSCDTCRKAVKWLQENQINAEIRDIRTDGISNETITNATTQLGWEKVLNRRSTRWRNLDNSQKENLDADKAIALIIQNPTLMKRPLLHHENQFIVGFDMASKQQLKTLNP